MESGTAVLLVGAGILGGLANAMAGGASFFTFPAMVAAGLPAVPANASNAFALLPANSIAGYVDRGMLPRFDRDLWACIGICLVGGLAGGILLLETPARYFELFVPGLIGLATILFVFGKSIQKFLAGAAGRAEQPVLRIFLVLLAGVYGGYFGAGVGVMYMAIIGITGQNWPLRSANALKNVLSFLTNLAAVIFFIWRSAISWPHALVMMSGTAVGGYMGGQLVKVLPAQLVRTVIATAGAVMTLVYAKRYWL